MTGRGTMLSSWLRSQGGRSDALWQMGRRPRTPLETGFSAILGSRCRPVKLSTCRGGRANAFPTPADRSKPSRAAKPFKSTKIADSKTPQADFWAGIIRDGAGPEANNRAQRHLAHEL